MDKKYSKHLDLAQNYWKKFLEKDDIVIDATCGNGHDSLFLAKIYLENSKGLLFCFDIQEKAIDSTLLLLRQNLSIEHLKRIVLYNYSHEDLGKYVQHKANLIVYNLGYLPNHDKTITTKKETTISSLKSALSLLADRGAISIMCYPGHDEGEHEEKALLSFAESLDSKLYSVCYHNWINRKKSPTLLWIEKKQL